MHSSGSPMQTQHTRMASLMPFGYWPIDPNSGVARPKDEFGKTVDNTTPDKITDFSRDWLLVGCEPPTMFKPSTEPLGFRWWWWDNSMMPHLRYVSPSNPKGNKHWSRLTYCGWALPHNQDGECLAPVSHIHRERVNRQLHQMSAGVHKDIADIWGGIKEIREPKRKHCLIIRSSDRNYREFYNITYEVWLKWVTEVLLDYGYTYEVRSKVAAGKRVRNQIADKMRQGGFDCAIANHSAGASECVVEGYPVITTSPWNPARPVSTSWSDFVATGELHYAQKEDIDRWITQVCAYTYNRPELDSLSWIDTHPDAQHLRSQQHEAE